MKKLLLLFAVASLLTACKSTQTPTTKILKGKLVVSALCAHYIVSLQQGNIDTAKLAAEWFDESRKTTFKNAFTVSSRCSFGQADLKEGDEFTFEIAEDSVKEQCAVCMAFYPTPQQTIAIKNIKKITP
jgi:hypothetical protein